MRVEARRSWAWVLGSGVLGVAVSCAAAKPESPARVVAQAAAPSVASSAPLPRPEPPAVEPAAIEPAHCKPALDPAPDAWEGLEGCSVTFKSGRVIEERSCTKAMCGDRDCCNRCSAGGLALYTGGIWLQLSSSKRPLACREGRDCTAFRDCDVPPGGAEVTGVLWRREGRWALDTHRFVHRVGPCTQVATELTADVTPTDRCRTDFSCDDGRQISVSCDGENDGTDTSLCECLIAGHTRSVTGVYRGEAPRSCERALEACLSAATKKP